ncbi:MAG: crossover junction endodeoxyribonuclease RuvC [Candidatus Omnitrophica bacterium]|nr:crossover junction endodeoxyribonuclease RuvC [Candidatus Omnitrophota bacterium]MCM8798033.1 crossover junction endodeoxyribonuclease RuvC [Candidatus Omnitrophota bacterium]
MRILGVDPGLNITGYGVLEVNSHFHSRLLETGVIKTERNFPLGQRVRKIYEEVKKIIKEFHPQVMVLEELYSHYRHPRTAILMGHARGVISLAAAEERVTLVGYSSTRIKKALLGRGDARKEQLQKMVRYLLNLKNIPRPVDVSDALALCLAHTYIMRSVRK